MSKTNKVILSHLLKQENGICLPSQAFRSSCLTSFGQWATTLNKRQGTEGSHPPLLFSFLVVVINVKGSLRQCAACEPLFGHYYFKASSQTPGPFHYHFCIIQTLESRIIVLFFLSMNKYSSLSQDQLSQCAQSPTG